MGDEAGWSKQEVSSWWSNKRVRRVEFEYQNHAIGRLGEQDLHTWAAENGFVGIYGASGRDRTPKGTAFRVHQPTTKGLDAIFFRPTDGQILICDNKGGLSPGDIADVGAFTSDFRKKINNRIQKIEAAKVGLSPQKRAHMDATIGFLQKAEKSLAKNSNTTWPKNVAVAITNFRGQAPGVDKALAATLRRMGIKNIVFVDGRTAQTRLTQLGKAPGSTTRRMSNAARVLRAGMTGFALAGTTFSMIAQANGSPGAATAAQMFDPKGLMKEAMFSHYRNLAQPKPDMRTVDEFLTDPSAAGGLRTIDLLNKSIGPFRNELRNHHASVQATAILEIARMAMTSRNMNAQDQIEMLDSLEEELALYHNDLRVVAENLGAAQELKPKVLEAAKGAESLSKLIEHPIATDQLFKHFTVQEINEMSLNLMRFSTSARQTFADIDGLASDVDRYDDEIYRVRDKLRREMWSIVLAPLINGAAPKEQLFQDDRLIVLFTLPGDVKSAIPLEEVRKRVRSSGSDFIPSVENVLRQLEQDGLVSTVSGPGVRHGKVWYRAENRHRPTADDGHGHVPIPGAEKWNSNTRKWE